MAGWGPTFLSLILSRVRSRSRVTPRHSPFFFSKCFINCSPSSAKIPVDVLPSPPVILPSSISFTALDHFHNLALTLSPEQAANLDSFIRDCHNKLAAADSLHFHRLHTDACILKSVHNISSPALEPSAIPQAIEYLDKAIIVSGAAGPGRHDLILDLIQRIQSEHISRLRPSPLPDVLLSTTASCTPAPVPAARHPVPRFDTPPSLGSFQRSFASRPFIVPGHASDWPALNTHPWNSTHYLRTLSGPGRFVPVEVGSDYRTDDWSQKIMGWDDFLTSISQPSNEVLYLAQHNLFLQFPNMREDVIVPDYVYSCLNSSDSFPDYRPPANNEQLVLNVWLGPKGTMSPAHVASGFHLGHIGDSRTPNAPKDPYNNCYGLFHLITRSLHSRLTVSVKFKSSVARQYGLRHLGHPPHYIPLPDVILR